MYNDNNYISPAFYEISFHASCFISIVTYLILFYFCNNDPISKYPLSNNTTPHHTSIPPLSFVSPLSLSLSLSLSFSLPFLLLILLLVRHYGSNTFLKTKMYHFQEAHPKGTSKRYIQNGGGHKMIGLN